MLWKSISLGFSHYKVSVQWHTEHMHIANPQKKSIGRPSYTESCSLVYNNLLLVLRSACQIWQQSHKIHTAYLVLHRPSFKQVAVGFQGSRALVILV